MSDFIGLCAVQGGGERKAQRDIERAGFGTRVLGYRHAFYRNGQRNVRVRALLPGYVLPQLSAGWGVINDIDGVCVLQSDGHPIRIVGKDEERLISLERHCLLGDFNRVDVRSANGQFTHGKRKRRSRRGRRQYRD